MVILSCCKRMFIVKSVGVPLPWTFSDLYKKLHCPAATQRLCSNIFSSLAKDSSFSTLVYLIIVFKDVSIPTIKRISPIRIRVNDKLCFKHQFSLIHFWQKWLKWIGVWVSFARISNHAESYDVQGILLEQHQSK